MNYILRSVPYPNWEITIGDNPLFIGSGAENQLAPQLTTVSKQHAVIQITDGALWVTGLKSIAGTFVNGIQVQKAELKPGDEVAFGESHWRVEGLAAPISPATSNVQPQKRYDSIGGWLVLPAIGLILTPIIGPILVFTDMSSIGNVQGIYQTIIVMNSIVQIILSIAAVILAVFFFQKKKFIPQWMTAFYLTNAIWVLLVGFMTSFAVIDVRSIIFSSIWAIYFAKSERVKGTFVN